METSPLKASALAQTVSRMASVVGDRYLLAGDSATAPFVNEPRDKYHGRAAAVVRPANTKQLCQIICIANETRTAVVPQGGNTGLVGGQTPDQTGSQIVVCLDRLNTIRKVDPAENAITVEAGVTLQAVQAAARDAGRFFPLSLASRGSCQIGGNLATNAGGVGVLAYGNARELCLGLEVVLADGRLLDGLKTLRKDNTGYDLQDMFIGCEGTLGIITAAAMKLFAYPASRVTAWLAVPDPQAALDLLDVSRRLAAGEVTAIELVPRIGVEFTMRHAGTRDPLAQVSPWYVLLEVSDTRTNAGLETSLEQVLAHALERNLVTDGAIAASTSHSAQFWRLREALSEVQRLEGGSIKHDVSVPVARTPELIERGCNAALALVPECRPVPFGHIGDGNIHFNISQPPGADKAEFLAKWDDMSAAIHAIVLDLGGSISAEHGIGVMKRDLMKQIKSPVELTLMQALKSTLDPNGILNPGKVLPGNGGVS